MSDTEHPPGTLLFEVKVSATGEVRDADGQLVSSSPVEFETLRLTEAQLAELGIPHPVHPDRAPQE